MTSTDLLTFQSMEKEEFYACLLQSIDGRGQWTSSFQRLKTDPEREEYLLESFRQEGPDTQLHGDLEAMWIDLGNINVDRPTEGFSLKGFQRLDNGLTFLGVEAGNDGDHPVFFIVYVDQANEVRAYVPEKGNSFNPETRTPYGSEDLVDAEPTAYEELPEELQASHETMLEDIQARFGLSPIPTRKRAPR